MKRMMWIGMVTIAVACGSAGCAHRANVPPMTADQPAKVNASPDWFVRD